MEIGLSRAAAIVAGFTVQALAFENDASTTVTVYAGGISVSDKLAKVQDSDRVPPFFWRDMQENVLPVPPVESEEGAEGGEGTGLGPGP